MRSVSEEVPVTVLEVGINRLVSFLLVLIPALLVLSDRPPTTEQLRARQPKPQPKPKPKPKRKGSTTYS